MADDELQVYSFPKNRDSEIRARLYSFDGRRYADLRVFVADDEDQLHPTRKGIAFKITDLPQMRAAIDALIRAAAGEGRAEAA